MRRTFSKARTNGAKYFVYEGAYYKPFAGDGETIYMVVEVPRQSAE